MKFCTKCGNELIDEAVVCTKCGSFVTGAPSFDSQPIANNQGQQKKKVSTFLMVSNFVFVLSACISLFFVICSLGCAWISVSAYENFYGGISFNAYSVPAGGALTVALISGINTFVFGVLAFSATLAGKHRGERLLAGISKLIIGIFMVILPFAILA